MSLNLIGTVSLDGSGWEAGMKRIEGATHRTAEVVKGLVISAFGVYGIEQAIHKTVEYGEHITNLSRTVGIGIEKLQEFGYAAKMNGLELDELALILERINKNRLDPAKAGSFAKLGVAKPGNTPIEDLVVSLHAAVKNRSSQEIAGPLIDIGGRSAWKAIAFLKDDIEGLAAEARRAGIYSAETAVRMKFLGDQMVMLGQTMLARLAPAISYMMELTLKFANVLHASGTFLGDVFASLHENKFFSNLLGHAAPAGPWNRTLSTPKELWQQFKDAISGAGTAFKEDLNDLNSATNKRLADLLSKQKDMEDINRNPDFDSVMKDKSKSGKNAPYSDSLLRIGNFLGAAQNPLERIAQEHTHLLRQIAHNTGMTAKQWGEKVVRDHNGFGHL